VVTGGTLLSFASPKESNQRKGDPTAQAQTGPKVKSQNEPSVWEGSLRGSAVPSVGRSMGLRLSVGVVCGVECQGWLQQQKQRQEQIPDAHQSSRHSRECGNPAAIFAMAASLTPLDFRQGGRLGRE